MSKDYTSTLNLPKTAFSMKANLPQREPETLKYWESIDLYNKMIEIDSFGFIGIKKEDLLITGTNEIKAVRIKPEAVDPDDVEMLEDLIIAAINDASAKADELSKDKMGPMGGLGGLM